MGCATPVMPRTGGGSGRNRLAGRQTARSEKRLRFAPSPRVVERSFGWMARFRRLARDYERLPETVVGLHFLAFSVLMLKNFVALLNQSS